MDESNGHASLPYSARYTLDRVMTNVTCAKYPGILVSSRNGAGVRPNPGGRGPVRMNPFASRCRASGSQLVVAIAPIMTKRASAARSSEIAPDVEVWIVSKESGMQCWLHKCQEPRSVPAIWAAIAICTEAQMRRLGILSWRQVVSRKKPDRNSVILIYR